MCCVDDSLASRRLGWGGIFKHRPMKPSRSVESEEMQQQQQQHSPDQRQQHQQRDQSTAAGTLSLSTQSGNSADAGGSTHPQHCTSSAWVWMPWTWFSRRAHAPDSDASCSASSGCCQNEASTSGTHVQRCRQGVTETGLPLSKFATASFDTVVDAFGLCSHDDPVQVCQLAAAWWYAEHTVATPYSRDCLHCCGRCFERLPESASLMARFCCWSMDGVTTTG